MTRTRRYSPEVRKRALRMTLEQEREYNRQWLAILWIAEKIGCTAETFPKSVRQSEIDTARRGGVTSDERAQIKELERENRKLRRANQILRKVAPFSPKGVRPETEAMMSFIDEHRDSYRVGPICVVLPIAMSAYYEQKAHDTDRSRLSEFVRRDAVLCGEIEPVWRQRTLRCMERATYGGNCNGRTSQVARCTVERLMHKLRLAGAVRERKQRITIPEEAAARPVDLLQGDFTATRPNQLSVADLTYVATWRGFVYVAFIIEVFSRMIVGWQVARSLRSDLALHALEQALYARPDSEYLVQYSYRGVQYLSTRYTERLAEAGIELSVSNVGNAYDNALAETIIGLYNAEVIRQMGPWRNVDHVEVETLNWVDWFNDRRLLEPIGNIPRAEFEKVYYERQEAPAL